MERDTELHLKPGILGHFGLPDIAYPLASEALNAALAGDGNLPFAEMLHALQRKSSEGGADWRSMEPAMDRLAVLLAPDDSRAILSAAGEDWWLEVGPVDLGSSVVTIQREGLLVAAAMPLADGRLRVAAYRPLDGKAAAYLIGLGCSPHPDHGVCMRENNWEYALDCAAANGNAYADDRGEAYLSCWDYGLGITKDGSETDAWKNQQGFPAHPAARVVVELGVHYMCANGE